MRKKEYYEWYIEAGLRIIPIIRNLKQPCGTDEVYEDGRLDDEGNPEKKKFYDATGMTKEQCFKHLYGADANLGWAMDEGKHLVLDIDTHHNGEPIDGVGNFTKMMEHIGVAKLQPNVKSATGGEHHYYLLDKGFEPELPTGTGLDLRGIELKKYGRFMCVPGSEVKGNGYTFNNVTLKKMPKALVDFLTPKKATIKKGQATTSKYLHTVYIVEEMLSWITHYDEPTWATIGRCIKDWGVVGGNETEAFDAWHDWSKVGNNYKGDIDCMKKWKSWKKVKGDPNLGLLVKLYKEAITSDFYRSGWAIMSDRKGKELFNMTTFRHMDIDCFNIIYHGINREERDEAPELAKGGKSKKPYKPYEILLKNDMLVPIRGNIYNPHTTKRILRLEDGNHLNTYQPGGELEIPAKMTEAGEKAWAFFLDHMRFITGDSGNVWSYLMVNWFAWQLQHPGKLLGFAPIIIGGQGIGKSVLGRFLGRCLGASNVNWISTDALVDKYTDWATAGSVGFMEELGTALDDKDKGKMFSRLKSVITEKTIATRPMWGAPTTATNYTNYIGFSNDRQLFTSVGEADDRRWKVFRTRQHDRRDALGKDSDYTKKLRAVLLYDYPQFIYKKLMEWEINENYANIQGIIAQTPASYSDNNGKSMLTPFGERVKMYIDDGKAGHYTRHIVGQMELRKDLLRVDEMEDAHFDQHQWKGMLGRRLHYNRLETAICLDGWEGCGGKDGRQRVFISSEMMNYISSCCEAAGKRYSEATPGDYKHLLQEAINDPDYIIPGDSPTKANHDGIVAGDHLTDARLLDIACLPPELLNKPKVELRLSPAPPDKVKTSATLKKMGKRELRQSGASVGGSSPKPKVTRKRKPKQVKPPNAATSESPGISKTARQNNLTADDNWSQDND